jgi:hypothetical protein
MHIAYFHHDTPDPDQSQKTICFALLCIPPAVGGEKRILPLAFITEAATR